MRTTRRTLALVAALVCTCLVPVSAEVVAAAPNVAVTAGAPASLAPARLAAIAPTPKAPKVIPARAFDPAIDQKPNIALRTSLQANEAARLSGVALDVVAADTTPPTAPSILSATSQQLSGITASWDGAQDPESAISYYVFGIGTVSSGDYNTLANTRWWQVSYDKSVSVTLSLTALATYYFSVYAVNGAGLSSAITTSGPIRPAYRDLGQAGNVLHVAFATTGYDASGNPTTGWQPDQVASLNSFFNKMYPFLVQLYGPPADDYTVTLVRDLRYHSTSIFIPANDEIRMDDGFYPQLITHELVHAFRNDHLLSSDQNWNYDATLSGFEESFAQAVSYEAMNLYVLANPGDSQVPGNSLWGSSNDWDYDFENMLELRGTDFWSEGGATGLYWLKYEMGAAAMRKINLESPDFYRRFNQAYYARINANPTTVRVSRGLIVDIIQSLVPQIEGMAAATWIDKQYIFYAQNVYGEKIFHRIQDYTASELYAFQDLYFLNTMSCGSEWACYDGTQWVYHRLNGAQGTGRLTDIDGNVLWSGSLLIEPTQNPSSGYFGIGHDTKSLTTAASNQPWPGGSVDDFILSLRTMGLYKFESTFIDPLTGAATTNSVYRVLGATIANNFQGVWGGVVGHRNGTVTLTHDGYAPVTIAVSNGVFAGATSWTGIANPRTGGRDTVPGRVSITFVDSDTGQTFQTGRNVDYGNANGSEMFLLDFGGNSPPADGTAPVAAISSPSAGATVFGTVTVSATATDNVGVTSVQFAIDGVNLGAAVAASPYQVSWNTTAVADGSHALRVTARDAAGNTTISTAVNVVVANNGPVVALTAPTDSSVVTGVLAVGATASSSSAITKVEFYRDATVLIGTSTTSPYTTNWDTAGLAQGSSHTVSAKAYAANGATATSATRTVTIKDTTAPAVAMTAPAAGSVLSSSVTVSANASDNVGVTKVEFYVDGVLVATDITAPYSASWNTNNSALGAHALTAKAYDLANNATTSASVAVTVSDTVKPTVSVTSPANNTQVNRGTDVTISATAADNRAVARVEFYVNDVLTCTDTATPYSCRWSVPGPRGARYTLRVRAYDTSNNYTEASVSVTSR
ncbi:MAG: hypothetical protein E6G39_17755 [Actinobacteria bacterium]|nr:MAG: hypothetical protein E6G39_17755 [Actinomycetota bacterium]